MGVCAWSHVPRAGEGEHGSVGRWCQSWGAWMCMDASGVPRVDVTRVDGIPLGWWCVRVPEGFGCGAYVVVVCEYGGVVWGCMDVDGWLG